MLSSPRASRTREQLSNQLRAGSVVIVYFSKQPILPKFFESLLHFLVFLQRVDLHVHDSSYASRCCYRIS